MIPLALLVGKSVLWGLRTLHRTGSALPGLVVEKLHKPFLPKMLAKLPRGVIVVSGTNGKTTTTKLITELLRAQGLKVLTNQTGSNFERGITSVVIDKARLSCKLDYDIAILELDEAHAVHFTKRVPPVGLVALNIMRDQMDRFGEIDTTAKLLQKLADTTTKWLVLNANDERISRIGKEAGDKEIIWFGYDASLTDSFITDDKYYDEAGSQHFQAAEPDICLSSDINDHGDVQIRIGDETTILTTKLEGSHNALNITAALAAVAAIMPEADPDKAVEALAKVEPAFGRGEHIELNNGGSLSLQLVKNPGGFSYVLQALKTQAKPDAIGIAINDDYADGRDVSWLWDVQFGVLHGLPKPFCGGVRGYDMAVRLKYDDIDAANVELELADFLKQCVDAAAGGKKTVIFTTYTAMLKLRKLLEEHGDIRKVGV